MANYFIIIKIDFKTLNEYIEVSGNLFSLMFEIFFVVKSI